MSDLNHQNFNPVQSNQQPDPVTIASAATIAPQTALTLVTGTVQLETITPPVSGYCELTLVFTDAAPGLFLTTGNILTAYQPVQNRPIKLFYNKPTNKWYVQAVA
jgi:hypothetical protein